MKEVAFLEKLAEALLEGGFSRALRPKLQPVQIAKALSREMERSQVVTADGPLVANRYLVRLHPGDFDTFSTFQASLERELAGYLKGYAERRGLRSLGSPSLNLISAEAIGRGKIQVEATLVDVEPAHQQHSQPPADWLGTVIMPSAQRAASPDVPSPPVDALATLHDEHGHVYQLRTAVTTIGRAIDNDIVLEVQGVSRHHARIDWEADHFELHDLGSTNGSFASGKRVTRETLSDGEILSFGGASFTFRLAGPEG